MFEVITSTNMIVNPQITTQVNNLLSLGFESVLLLLVGGMTYGVKLGISMIKNSLIRAFATRAVSWAENRMVGDVAKRQMVAAKIHDKFPRLSTDEIDHYLEEAVSNMQTGLVVAEAPPAS